jgi:CRP-like cAMP-binding protein
MQNELLCNCPIASVCSRSRGPFREVQRPQHNILYVEGEAAKHIYMIRKGSVSLHRASTENRALGRTCALRHDGALVGVEALVSDVYQSSARAETPLLLCMATTTRITEWLSERSAASRVLLEAVLKSREEEFLPQSSPDGTAVQRVAQWLLNRSDVPSERNLPRNVMADMLGMRPETLSRALHALADLGFIEVGRRHVLIVDPDGLRNTLPI